MRRPHEFGKAAILACIGRAAAVGAGRNARRRFAVICCFYAPVVFLAHFAYGDSLRDSMVNSIQTSWIQSAVNLLIAAHCLMTLTFMVNPLNQEAEEMMKVPYEFSWKRVVVRTSVLTGIVFVAVTMPTFGPGDRAADGARQSTFSVLNLIGASTVTLTCVIFPALFFFMLSARERKIREQHDRAATCTIRE